MYLVLFLSLLFKEPPLVKFHVVAAAFVVVTAMK